jgi:hypothetical protein
MGSLASVLRSRTKSRQVSDELCIRYRCCSCSCAWPSLSSTAGDQLRRQRTLGGRGRASYHIAVALLCICPARASRISDDGDGRTSPCMLQLESPHIAGHCGIWNLPPVDRSHRSLVINLAFLSLSVSLMEHVANWQWWSSTHSS